MSSHSLPVSPDLIDSRYAFWRLLNTLVLVTLGSAAMYVVVVILPVAQAEFGSDRAGASLPYTALMIAFGVGSLLMGRLADRFGVYRVLIIGGLGNLAGFLWASQSPGLASHQGKTGVIGDLGDDESDLAAKHTRNFCLIGLGGLKNVMQYRARE